MPRKKKGGTDKWCPYCQSIQTQEACRNIITGESSGNFHSKFDESVNYFRRNLYCLNCNEEHGTAEVEAKILHDLIRLRTNLESLNISTDILSSRELDLKLVIIELAKALNKIGEDITLK